MDDPSLIFVAVQEMVTGITELDLAALGALIELMVSLHPTRNIMQNNGIRQRENRHICFSSFDYKNEKGLWEFINDIQCSTHWETTTSSSYERVQVQIRMRSFSFIGSSLL
ncbi:MAG: hypothetical protein V1844_08200 [Pseudomonadota bacterium]